MSTWRSNQLSYGPAYSVKRDNGCVSYRYYSFLQASGVAFYPVNGIEPALVEPFPFRFRHAKLKATLATPQLGDFLQVLVPAKAQPGHVSGPESSGFKYRRTVDLNAQHVGKKLN